MDSFVKLCGLTSRMAMVILALSSCATALPADQALPKPIRASLIFQDIPSMRFFSVALSHDRKWIVTGGRDAKLWEIATGKFVRTYHGHAKGIDSVAFSPDDKSLATASSDKTVRLWEVATGKEIFVFAAHESWVVSVDFSPDGKFLVTGSQDNIARVWDLETGKQTGMVARHEGLVGAAFANGGKSLTTVGRSLRPIGQEDKAPVGREDKTIKQWDIATGKVSFVLNHGQEHISCCFSSGGKYVATVQGSAIVWDLAAREKIGRVGKLGGVNALALSSDGRWLVAWTLDIAKQEGNAELWDLSSGKHVRTFLASKPQVYAGAFDVDAKWLVTGGGDGTARLFEVETGKQMKIFRNFPINPGKPENVQNALFTTHLHEAWVTNKKRANKKRGHSLLCPFFEERKGVRFLFRLRDQRKRNLTPFPLLTSSRGMR